MLDIASDKLYKGIPLSGEKRLTEYGLRMDITTTGFKYFDHAIVYFTGNLDVCVKNESSLVKMLIKHRDVAGLYFF